MLGWRPDFGVEREDSKISAGTVSSPSLWQLLRVRLGRRPGKHKCALHPCLQALRCTEPGARHNKRGPGQNCTWRLHPTPAAVSHHRPRLWFDSNGRQNVNSNWGESIEESSLQPSLWPQANLAWDCSHLFVHPPIHPLQYLSTTYPPLSISLSCLSTHPYIYLYTDIDLDPSASHALLSILSDTHPFIIHPSSLPIQSQPLYSIWNQTPCSRPGLDAVEAQRCMSPSL